MKSVLVFGSGAVGIYYGTKLMDAGVDVVFLCRSDYTYAKANGLTVHEKNKIRNYYPKVISNMSEIVSKNFDMILISTKALDSINLGSILSSVVGSNTVFCLIQNGLHVEKSLAKAFPNHQLITVVAFCCLQRIRPATVTCEGYNRLIMGMFPDDEASKECIALYNLFNRVSVSCCIKENMQEERWKKLLWNVPFNALSVLAGNLDTEQMLAAPAFLDTIRAIMQEVSTLAAAAGYELSTILQEEYLSNTFKMGAYKTSMLWDVEKKRPIEVEALFGNLLRFAQQKRLAAPWIAFFYTALKSY